MTQLYFSLSQAQPTTPSGEVMKPKYEKKIKNYPISFFIYTSFWDTVLFFNAHKADSACWVFILYFKMFSQVAKV